MGRPKGSKNEQPRKERSDRGTHKNWEKSPIYQDNVKEMPEGYNTRRIRFMQAIMPTEPLDKNDVAEMERRFQRYIELCAEWDMKVGNQGAYMAIGITKENVYDWTTRVQSNPARTHFIKEVQQFCANYREGLMEDGKINPVTGIFWQKNYDGMRDQQEVVLTPNVSPLGDQADAEALKQKYLENTYGYTPELPDQSQKVPEIVRDLPDTEQKAPEIVAEETENPVRKSQKADS